MKQPKKVTVELHFAVDLDLRHEESVTYLQRIAEGVQDSDDPECAEFDGRSALKAALTLLSRGLSGEYPAGDWAESGVHVWGNTTPEAILQGDGDAELVMNMVPASHSTPSLAGPQGLIENAVKQHGTPAEAATVGTDYDDPYWEES